MRGVINHNDHLVVTDTEAVVTKEDDRIMLHPPTNSWQYGVEHPDVNTAVAAMLILYGSG